jgi:hypothetical protein
MNRRKGKDDREAARHASIDELRENLRFVREAAAALADLVIYDDAGNCNFPEYLNDGEGVFIPVPIGARGNLSKAEAEQGAAMWRQVTSRYPKACFMLCLLGYNDDPREIWEFPDARRYVRWWARFAGMDDIATANRWVGASSMVGRTLPQGAGGIGFLAACGVFSKELQQQALRDYKPLTPQ